MGQINDMMRLVNWNSIKHGWWDGFNDKDALHILGKLALVHSEVSEAGECVRDGEMEDTLSHAPLCKWVGYPDSEECTPKPEGLPSELADVIIRVLDLAGYLEIDMEKAITRKMDYNVTREHRHGGRRA